MGNICRAVRIRFGLFFGDEFFEYFFGEKLSHITDEQKSKRGK
tara:strand:+ start:337 stop:465 length:129 start_codon:yes stop_codon:yes gene_type:complete